MPFLIYGRDSRTGEIVRRIDDEAHTEDGARRAAEAHGIHVTVVVPDPDKDAVAHALARPLRPGDKPAPDPVLASESATFQRELHDVTPSTPVTYALVGINLAVFVVMAISGVSIDNPTIADLLRWGADFGPLTLGGEPWRLFTSTFVHIGLMHVASNMLVFAYVGPTVERMLGNVGFLVLYLVAGLAGSLWALYWNPLQVEAGASGAIFGIYGALVAMLLRDRDSIPPHVGAKLLRFATIFVFYNLINSLGPGISMAAHVGGLVAGFACGFAIAQPITIEAVAGRALRNIAALGAGALLLVAGLGGAHVRFPNLDGVNAALERFGAAEADIPKAIKAMRTRADDDADAGAEAAETIEQTLMPQWRAVEEDLAALKPIPATMADDIASIIAYMRQREANWQDLADAWRSADEARIDAAENTMRTIDETAWDIDRSPLVRLPHR
jgi:membrane associated rhomboid family serine protease